MIGCLQVVCRVRQRTFAALIASCHVPVVGNGFSFYNIYVIVSSNILKQGFD